MVELWFSLAFSSGQPGGTHNPQSASVWVLFWTKSASATTVEGATPKWGYASLATPVNFWMQQRRAACLGRKEQMFGRQKQNPHRGAKRPKEAVTDLLHTGRPRVCRSGPRRQPNAWPHPHCRRGPTLASSCATAPCPENRRPTPFESASAVKYLRLPTPLRSKPAYRTPCSSKLSA